MIGYDCLDWEDAPAVARGAYCLWRLMIDARYQGRGYGRRALQQALSYIRTFPCGPSEHCWLSYEPGNLKAKRLYESFGFAENGQMDGKSGGRAAPVTLEKRTSHVQGNFSPGQGMPAFLRAHVHLNGGQS